MDKEKLLKKLKEIIPDKKRIVAHDIPEKYLSDTLGKLALGDASIFYFILNDLSRMGGESWIDIICYHIFCSHTTAYL